MNQSEKMVTVEECTEQVRLMARRTALLHYYFAKTIMEVMGEETGEQVIKKAVLAYGEHCGRAIREAVEAKGLPLTDENFDSIPDLPKFGWETDTVTLPDGEVRAIARFCPLAHIFKELGPEGMRLGRLYCFVDQGKQRAYNPDFDFIHVKNLLDGDAYCEFLLQPHQE